MYSLLFITFCKASLRAYEAQTILEGAGFQDVQFMDGGLEAWPYDGVAEGWTLDS